MDVLPQDLVKFRCREIRIYTFPIALQFNRHIGRGTAEMPVKYQSGMYITTSNLAASRIKFTRFGGETFYRLVNRDPEMNSYPYKRIVQLLSLRKKMLWRECILKFKYDPWYLSVFRFTETVWDIWYCVEPSWYRIGFMKGVIMFLRVTEKYGIPQSMIMVSVRCNLWNVVDHYFCRLQLPCVSMIGDACDQILLLNNISVIPSSIGSILYAESAFFATGSRAWCTCVWVGIILA